MTKPATPPRQLVLLGVLGVVLVGLVIFQVLPMLGSGPPSGPTGPGPSAVTTAPNAQASRPANPRGPGGTRVSNTVEEVALSKLEAPWPEPVSGHRNPFTMQADPPPQAARAETSLPPPTAVVTQPTGPPPPPPLPPITLKFIGVLSGPTQVGRIAALSDGKFVYHGREGQIIEGRYRIVRIGEESIQVEYADGRGRQTIRLTGK
jgi:hypothetical protein